MIHIITFLLLSLQTCEVTVEVYGLKNQKGNLYIGFYTNEKNFLKEPVNGKVIPVNQAQVISYRFDGIKPGNYAIAIYHDTNENNQLDTNFLGIPTEPYGFSNNSMGIFSPPTFSKASFTVDALNPLLITINL